MNWPVRLFVLATFANFFCAAVNCYTLRVAYPLWRFVGDAEFAALHREYLRRLDPVITFPHIVLFFADLALLRWRPAFFSFADACFLSAAGVGVVLVSLLWAGPIHSRFERTGVADATGLDRLVGISVLRSVLMLAASGWICWRLAQRLG